MEKKVLLKKLTDGGTRLRTEFTPTAVVSDFGEHPIGEFWDANKTVDVIVNGSHKDHDTIRELDKFAHDTKDQLDAEIERATAAEEELNEKIENRYTKAETDTKLSVKFGNAEYDPDSKRINFYSDDTKTTVLKYIDTTDFVKDGMVHSVVVKDGKLIITFNTDSGKDPIEINISDIFDSENYYTKDDVDDLLDDKADKTELFSGSYNDLTDKPSIPTVPTNVSAFTNDAGYLTEHQSLTDYYTKTEVEDLIEDATGVEYGIQWTSANTTPYRIGNTNLHKSLPIQSLMKRCIKTSEGFKYIDPNDYTKYEDGTTVNYSTDGDLFVKIPKYWYRAYTEKQGDTTIYTLMLYTKAVTGAMESKEVYIGAVEASSDDASNSESPKLYSIIKTNISYGTDGSVSESNLTYTDDATSYRGGSARGDSSKDEDLSTRLGRPVTNLTRAQFRTRAAARGIGYSQQYWTAYMAWVRLYVVEYCSFNSQATYNSSKTTEGFMQGGLGNAVTTINFNAWNSYNSYNPFVPCGVTLKLVNTTGVITYSNNTFTVSVPSYRGIENPFGHVWKWTDGLNVYGANGKKDLYVCNDITKFADDTAENYVLRGTTRTMEEGYIKDWLWDENGDFLPLSAGGSSNSYLYDYTWLQYDGWKVCGSGGYAHHGAGAGLFCFYVNDASSSASADVGGRLYFTPQN